MNGLRAWAMIAGLAAGGVALTASVAAAAGHGGGGGFHGGGMPVLGGALSSRPAVGLGGAVRGGHAPHGAPAISGGRSFNGGAAFARGGFAGRRGFRGRWQGGYAFGWWPGDYELAAYDQGYARDAAEEADGPYRVVNEPPACPVRYLWNAKTRGFDRQRLCGD